MRESQTPVITVIIPTHERGSMLHELLLGLQRQSLPASQFEVIIVDDASREDPSPGLMSQHWNFELIAFQQPKAGPAAARNKALKRARGEYILFLNDDIRVHPRLLQEHLLAQQAQSRPTAVLGAFAYPLDVRKDRLSRLLEDQGVVITTKHFQSGSRYSYQVFWTGNLSIARSLLDDVGHFNEAFHEPSHEDIELGVRLERLKGVEVQYHALASVEHLHPMNFAAWRRQKRMGGRNAWRVHRLHKVLSLGTLEKDGVPDSLALDQWWYQYQQQTPMLSHLESIIGQALNDPTFSSPPIRLNGTEFHFPADIEAFVASALSIFDQQDQLAGIVEAARNEQQNIPY